MSKSFKKLVAIVSAIAMVIAGITVQPQTANAAEALEWSELTDGLGKATIKNTSTEEVRGAEYKGFETDRSWGGDSKWQGQAKVNDVTVEAGQAYKVSLDVSSTPAKKILVQTLSGGEYVEKEYDTTVGHIEQTFAANNDKVNIVVAFGSFSDDEVGKYDVSISNFKLEKTEKSEEQIEKERVEALLTGDENIAKGKTAFSNSVKEKDYQPEEAFDGNLGSRYAATSYESGVTLGVDLGKTYKVSSVAFKWENAYATEYNIQVSKDGKAYDTVKTMTADKAETIEVPLDEAVEARYVRIECVKNALNYGYSLWEMGVYGTEVAEVETTTNTPVVEPGTGETTTPAKQDETTTPAKQDETTTPAPVAPTVPVAAEKDWSAEDFISSSDATYNDTYKAIKDGAINEIVNIQPADDTLGLYVSFADADFGTITVNGKTADIKAAGAGIWFKLSNFTDMYNDVVITNGAGTVKATLYVYNKNGVDNSKKDDETTTAAKQDETTPAKQDETTTPAKQDETTTPAKQDETTTPAKQDETTTPAKQDETTTPAKQDETTTAKQDETTTAKQDVTTTTAKQNETTTVAPTTKAISTTAAPATVKKTTVKKTTVKATAKKLSSNKVKLSVKKVAGASKYAVQISTTKNFKKVVAKKTSKKAVFTVKSKKLKGKKKLYVRVKVYKKVNGKTVASQWSKATKIRLKK
ncbi:MAG: discoidin domain-containing protein [Eubacterium ventriosum]|nr:discoidin domain-containing protein [Eubacterium ventriosum]